MNPTPLRAIRIPDDLWERLREKAREDGSGASETIRRLISEYLDK